MTKFVHVRNFEWDGRLSPRGGVTIAYNFDPETRQASYYSAKCNDKDHYNKKIGRRITAGRLSKYGGTTLQVPEGQKVADFVTRHLMREKYGYVFLNVTELFGDENGDTPDTAPSSTEPTVH